LTKETIGQRALAPQLRLSISTVGAEIIQLAGLVMNTLPFADPRKAGGRESRAKRRDFYRRYDALLANWYLLTHRVQEEILSIRQELRNELASWRPHLPEPDWNAYVDRMSVIAAKAAAR
jgi:hypothetical protein